MKKAITFFLIFVLVMTIALQQLGWFDTQSWVKTEIITKNEVTLNEFVETYDQWIFEKIELIDATTLIWYESTVKTWSTTTANWFVSMALRKNVTYEYFNQFVTNKPIDTSLSELWLSITWATTIDVIYNEKSLLQSLFFDQVLPILLLIILFIAFFRFFGPKGGGFPFATKVGKLNTKKEVNTKFSDIAWMDEVKWELQEIVDFLKNPQKYHKVWARTPKWVLLHGVPWSGKTLLARAIAGEAHVPFFSASWSEFMEMLVGMGAAKVRELFNKAKTAGKAIIFIDEIDAIGKKRGGWHTWWHQEQEQTLNQILTEMDGFNKNTNVIVIAATNRPDTLDPALLRSGRFDRKIMVGRPTLEERMMILNYYLKAKKTGGDINLDSLARRTSGLVGADLENIVNEASLKLARENRTILEARDFEYSLEKVLMWPEKRIKTMSEKERKIVAYHELGHAVTANELPYADPVEKISIVSRGMALWVTRMIPEEDKYLSSKEEFHDQLVTLLGGRAAEEIFFGKNAITTWASNDFERATHIGVNMVLKYGMDDDLGPVLYLDKDKDEYAGHFKRYSDKTSEIADEKIKNILVARYEEAKKILKKHSKKIDQLALILLDKEYLTKDEFEQAMKDDIYLTKLQETTRKEKELHEKMLQKSNDKKAVGSSSKKSTTNKKTTSKKQVSTKKKTSTGTKKKA